MNEDIVVSPVYDHVTQLDFTAPHQFLTMIPDIEVVVASIGAKPVISHGPSFDRLADLDKIDKCDVICFPGGLGCIDAIENKRFLDASGLGHNWAMPSSPNAPTGSDISVYLNVEGLRTVPFRLTIRMNRHWASFDSDEKRATKARCLSVSTGP